MKKSNTCISQSECCLLGAVPVPTSRARAHPHPPLGASQDRQLLSLHATKQRRETPRTIQGTTKCKHSPSSLMENI